MWETMKVFSKWANLKYVYIFQKNEFERVPSSRKLHFHSIS